MKKIIVIFLVFLLLSYFAFDYYNKSSSAKKGPSGSRGDRGGSVATAVETEMASRRDMRDLGEFFGSAEPYSKFNVVPRVSGRIKSLNYKLGDTIKSGALVAELEDDEYRLALEQANASLEIAEANYKESETLLKTAEKDLQRIQTMHKQKIASVSNLEQAEAAYDSRKARNLVNAAQVKQAQTAVKQAELRLAYTKIDAVWTDGSEERLIAEKFLSEGGMANTNSPLVSIIDIETLIIAVDVTELDYHKLKNGMEVFVTSSSYPDKQFKGRIARLAPMLDVASRQARAEIELENPDYLLKPGIFVNAVVIYDTHENVLTVPAISLVNRRGVQGVFEITPDRKNAKFVPVKTGYSTGKYIEITEPENLGEIVTLGYHLLEDGAAVNIGGIQEAGAKSDGKRGKQGEGKMKTSDGETSKKTSEAEAGKTGQKKQGVSK